MSTDTRALIPGLAGLVEAAARASKGNPPFA